MALNNNVQLVGWATMAPTLHQTENGGLVAAFSLQTTDRVIEKGVPHHLHQHHHITIQDPHDATLLSQIADGSSIVVQGRLLHSFIKTKNGDTRWLTQVQAHHLLLCDGDTITCIRTRSEVPTSNTVGA